jgi:hypothetical protein
MLRSPLITLFRSVLLIALTAVVHAESPSEGTHRQAAILKPDPQRELVTFVVAPDGVLTAALGAERRGQMGAGLLRVYSPERALIREIPLPIMPTALSLVGKSGYLVAGNGKLLQVSPEGRVTRQATILELLGVTEEQVRSEARRAAEESVQAQRERSAREIADLERAIQTMESAPAQTDRQKARIVSSKKMLEERRAELKREPSLDSMMDYFVSSRTKSTALSSDGNSILMTLMNLRQYEVLKLDQDFRNPRRILGDLKGCCGQMDLNLSGGRFFTAENTRFKVGIYDLEGKKQGEFGERFEKNNQGFGSCCNPMNVWVYGNGDVLTAESSIGTLKRFSPEGKLLGVIGRARIGGGCKHVAIGHDPVRDRYYVQYQDRNHICVLMPEAEAAPLVAEQDRQIAKGEALLQALAGSWVVEPRKGAKSAEELDALFQSPRGMTLEDRIAGPIDRLQAFIFQPNHSLTLGRKPQRQPSRPESPLRWVVTGTEGDSVQIELEEADGIVRYTLKLRKLSETNVQIQIHEYLWTLTKS